MKNFKLKSLLLIITILTFLIFTKTNLFARSISISNHDIRGTINTDGTIDISEYITFDFSGQYNGVFHNVSYEKASKISDFEVYKINSDGSSSILLKNFSGNPNTYEYTEENSIAKIKLYSPSQNTKKTFLFKYKIHDVIKKYNDISELYWQFISSDNETPNTDVAITLNIPDGASKDELKIFAHGPLSGYSEIIDNKTVSLTLDYLPPSTFLEVRLLFPNRLINDSYPTDSSNNFDSIMEEELTLAEESDEAREQLPTEPANNGLDIPSIMGIIYLSLGTFALPISLIILAIILYFKFLRLPKPFVDYDYIRELPGEYSPAIMSELFNNCGIKDISATILDLVRKKVLVINEEKNYINGLFGDKEIDVYIISKNESFESSNIELEEHENFLINWFINKLGTDGKINLYNLQEKLSSSDSLASKFRSDLSKWKKLVSKTSMSKYKLLTKGIFIDFSPTIRTLLAVGVGIIVFIFPFNIIPAIILAFVLFKTRKTIYGNEQYYKWKAFKKYLKDFSMLDGAEVPSLVIWEHYLVYAVSLGVAKTVIKHLKLVIPEEQFNNTNLTYLHGSSNIIISGGFESFESSMNSLSSASSRSDSSSSGSGGGFSSGGGGGGGGSSSGGF